MRKLAFLVALALGALAACSSATSSGIGVAGPGEDADASTTPPSPEPAYDEGGAPQAEGKADSGSPAPGVDAGPKPPSVDASLPPPASACNAVVRGTVTPVAISGFADLKGGTIADGTYKATAYKRYINGTSGTTFPPISLGLTVQANALQFASTYGGNERDNYTFTVTGNKLSLTRTCGGPGLAVWYFDASGDTLTIYGFPGSNDIWYATLQRQP